MVDIRDLSDEELARFTRTRRDDYELVRDTARLVLHERYGGLMEELENDRPRRKRLDTEGLRKQVQEEIGARIEPTDTPPGDGSLNLDYNELSDEELLWRYGTKDDDDAFAELFERHRTKFLRRWQVIDEDFFGRHEEELTDCVRVAFQRAAESEDAFADSKEGCMRCVKGLVEERFRGFIKGLGVYRKGEWKENRKKDDDLVLLCRMSPRTACDEDLDITSTSDGFTICGTLEHGAVLAETVVVNLYENDPLNEGNEDPPPLIWVTFDSEGNVNAVNRSDEDDTASTLTVDRSNSVLDPVHRSVVVVFSSGILPWRGFARANYEYSTAENLSPEARRISVYASEVLYGKYARLSEYMIREVWYYTAGLHGAAEDPKSIYHEALHKVLEPGAYSHEGRRSFKNYLLWRLKKCAQTARRRRTPEVKVAIRDLLRRLHLGELVVKHCDATKSPTARASQEKSLSDATEVFQNPLKVLLRKELLEKVREALEKESQPAQELVDMLYREGLGYGDCQDELKRSPKALMQLLWRTKRKIAKYVRDNYGLP